jgi:hypothetical protein
MKKKLILFAILVLSGSMLFAQGIHINFDVLSGRRHPDRDEAFLMRREENSHPRIAQSMHNIENVISTLNNSPDDFGGHKSQAIADLQQALTSLRKALYFKIYQDNH